MCCSGKMETEINKFCEIDFVLKNMHLIDSGHADSSMPHRKNVLTLCISVYHVIGLKPTCSIQNITRKAPKKIVGVVVYCKE